jgi:hypothetical protein
VQRRGLAHQPDDAIALPHVPRHARRERADALGVLGRVVVAVLRGEREPAQRVDADRLGVAERAQDLTGDDRLQLAEPHAHLAVLEHQPQPADAPLAQRPAVGDELRDRQHRRSAVEPERVEPRPHGLGIGVAETEHDLRLRGRRLGRDEVQSRHQIDRRAARRRQLGTQRLSRLPVPADNQYAGAGQGVVIHTQT